MGLALYLSVIPYKPQLWQTALLLIQYLFPCCLTERTLILSGALMYLAKDLFLPAVLATDRVRKFLPMRSK